MSNQNDDQWHLGPDGKWFKAPAAGAVGWQCPKCGRGNAPWLATCECGPSITTWPSVGTNAHWVCARCGTYIFGTYHVCPYGTAIGGVTTTAYTCEKCGGMVVSGVGHGCVVASTPKGGSAT